MQNQNNPTSVRPAPQPQQPQPPQPNQSTAPQPKKAVRPIDRPQVGVKVKKLPRGSVSRENKEYFVENLSMLIASGVTVGEALETIAKEMPSRKVKKAIMDMCTKVDEGSPFWLALRDSGVLNTSAVALIKAGEESGRLSENLHVVADQIHKNNMMTAKVRSALLYPAFLIVLLIIVGSGIGLFLLPKLADIFKGLNVDLPWFTKMLISFGQFWGKWGLLCTGLFFVVVFIFALLVVYSSAMRRLAEGLLFKLPGLKQLFFESEISRFGFILGSLLEAGLPVVEALDSLSDSMATKRYRDITAQMKASIDEGNSFVTTFENIKDKKAFPGPIRQLIVSGEKSGNLAQTLLKMSKIYEDKAEITAKNLETLLEPVILVLIAIGVLFVALAVIVPIYSLIGGLEPPKK